ncbi:MAG: hypothetical protein HKO66_16115 [Saprospiraceae bacterium]|nr:hypothetical protein [Bacteroidia bacterium]NNE16558.1 hypothetical protein [Saprospiraceae bacterium]NNL93769.1 hypothetical protein [Saprospiraceae bacterium]
MNKPRIVKDFEKLTDEVLAQIKLEYPYGFEKKLILFKNKEGKLVSALPFETETYYYLIRMTIKEAQQIIEEDDDYDDDGNLTVEAIEKLEDELEEAED